MSTKGKTKHTRRHRRSTRTQVQGTHTHGARMQGTCTRKQRALPTSALSTSLQEAVCKHQGSAGVWIWAILVSQRCVMVHLPWRHVERRSFDHTFVFQLRSCVLAERMLRMPRAWAAMLLVCAPVHFRRAAIPARHSCRLVCAPHKPRRCRNFGGPHRFERVGCKYR